MFLLGFVGFGIFSIIENEIASIFVGGLMIGGAYLLLQKNQGVFAEYFSLAISLAGQALALRRKVLELFLQFGERGVLVRFALGQLPLVGVQLLLERLQ